MSGEMLRLGKADDVEPGSAKRYDVDGHRIALVRIGDDFYALGDRCSHEDFSLSEGEVLVDECEIECWKHGSTFALTTGEPQSLPAVRPVPVYDVVREGDEIFVKVSREPEAKTQATGDRA